MWQFLLILLNYYVSEKLSYVKGFASRLRRPLTYLGYVLRDWFCIKAAASGGVIYPRGHCPRMILGGEELHVSVRSYTDMSGALPRPPYFYTWAMPTYKSRIRGKLQQQYKKILMYSKKTHFFRDLIVIILWLLLYSYCEYYLNIDCLKLNIVNSNMLTLKSFYDTIVIKKWVI